ncbi:MAG: SMI1/KNR4 family protein [Candidatus Sericytochromatia bacterium]
MKLIFTEINAAAKIEDIHKFEREFNIKLPQSYKKFLLDVNGGKPTTLMRYKTNTEIWGDISIYTFESLEEMKKSLIYLNKSPENNYYLEESMKKGVLIIALEGLSEISIGIKENNLGKVYMSNFTENIDLELISESFEAFINGFEYYDGISKEEIEELEYLKN